jgi:uncharacterized protein with FMN-binding domain
MKKLLLSALAVVAFVAYALVQRGTGGATGTPITTSTSTTSGGGVSGPGYADGKYLGDVANTAWGDVQVQVVIDKNRIASVSTVQYPHDRPLSAKINQIAIPMLEQEVVHVQSTQVDLVTGATVTTEGFIASLMNALSQAGG